MGKLVTTVSAAGIALGLVAGLSAPADAQSQYNWSGLYLGANFGGGFGGNTTTAAPNSDAFSQATLSSAFAAGVVPSRASLHQSGVIGGLQARYNWQFGNVVLGPDFDVNGANISDTKSISTAVTGFPAGSFSVKQNLDFLTTLRGQIGFTPMNRLLLFANAGLAVGHVNYNANGSFPAASYGTSTSHMNFGGTAGAGVEYAVTDNLTVRGEYMFVDLGSQRVFVSGSPGGVATAQTALSYQNYYHIFRLGVTYHFAPPAPPPPTPAVAPAPPPPPPAAVPSKQDFIVFFEFDKSTLTPEGQQVVNAAAAAYKKGGSAKMAVAGYTDRAGTPTYNMKLSQRRAETVHAALVKLGVPDSQIGVSWHGEENPRVPTPDGVREPQNRRVEIEF